MPCIKCVRGDHKSCTGYDGPTTVHPDSLSLCPCPCPLHSYDLDAKTCGCGAMMWPEDHEHHLNLMRQKGKES